MLTAHDVKAAYRLLLGRLPESADVIAHNIDYATFESLLENLLTSEEFLDRLRGDAALQRAFVPAVRALSLAPDPHPRRKVGWIRQGFHRA